MNRFRFTCFLLTRASADRLIARLVKEGFDVSGSFENNQMFLNDQDVDPITVSTALNLKIKTLRTRNELAISIKHYLQKLFIPYFGFMVRDKDGVMVSYNGWFPPTKENDQAKSSPYRD